MTTSSKDELEKMLKTAVAVDSQAYKMLYDEITKLGISCSSLPFLGRDKMRRKPVRHVVLSSRRMLSRSDIENFDRDE